MRTMPHFRLTNSQRNGVFLLSLLIILSEVGIQLLKNQAPKTTEFNFSQEELVQLQQKIDSVSHQSPKPFQAKPTRNKISYQQFNPNQYSKQDWVSIGFSQKQAQTILNYKNSLGGSFLSKQQLKKCYAISDQKYQELEQFLLLPTTHSVKKIPKNNRYQSHHSFQKEQKKSYPLAKFNPNLYNKQDWVRIGFTPKQANTILNFKRSLGGSFTSKEQIKQCYAISDQKFAEIAPHIMLPTTAPKTQPTIAASSQPQTINPKKVGINQASAKDLFPFVANKKVAYTLINFRKSIGGFHNKEQVLKVYGIKPQEVDSILKYFPISN